MWTGHPQVHTNQASCPAWQQGMGQEHPVLPRPPSSHTCPAQPLHPRMYREDSPQPLPSSTFTPSLLLLFFSELSP